MWPAVAAVYPIYNGAKPEYPCSVFLGAFSGLRRENDELPYAALRPTSSRLSRDVKTATPGAGAEQIAEEPLRPPCFPDNDAIFVRGCQGSAKWQCKGKRCSERSSARRRQQSTMPKRQGPRNPQAKPAKRPCFGMTLRSSTTGRSPSSPTADAPGRSGPRAAIVNVLALTHRRRVAFVGAP